MSCLQLVVSQIVVLPACLPACYIPFIVIIVCKISSQSRSLRGWLHYAPP